MTMLQELNSTSQSYLEGSGMEANVEKPKVELTPEEKALLRVKNSPLNLYIENSEKVA